MAALKSPKGGSGKLLSWVKQHKIKGIISNLILDEILRNATKVGKDPKEIQRVLLRFFYIHSEPRQKTVEQFKEIVSYLGDAHVLASFYESKANLLVTLDQKHLLILQNKIKDLKIITPGQLIELLTVK